MSRAERGQLDGRVALVTGAARRIGRAIALALADEGAAVIVNARSSLAEARAVAAEIETSGGRALVHLADVTDEAMAEYIRCCTPENIHGVCEDYRAAIEVDFEMDRIDLEAGRKVQCPLLVLWGENSHVERSFEPVHAWSHYTANVARARRLPSGHYPAEQCPDETYGELISFFRC